MAERPRRSPRTIRRTWSSRSLRSLLDQLHDGVLVGVEALARWDHPQLGRIGAETLFALAERGDHVAQLSRHIAGKALAAAAAGWGKLALSLNVTAEDLASEAFAADFRELLVGTGFVPTRLTLEVTEHALVADFAQSAAALAELERRQLVREVARIPQRQFRFHIVLLVAALDLNRPSHLR